MASHERPHVHSAVLIVQHYKPPITVPLFSPLFHRISMMQYYYVFTSLNICWHPNYDAKNISHLFMGITNSWLYSWPPRVAQLIHVYELEFFFGNKAFDLGTVRYDHRGVMNSSLALPSFIHRKNETETKADILDWMIVECLPRYGS